MVQWGWWQNWRHILFRGGLEGIYGSAAVKLFLTNPLRHYKRTDPDRVDRWMLRLRLPNRFQGRPTSAAQYALAPVSILLACAPGMAIGCLVFFGGPASAARRSRLLGHPRPGSAARHVGVGPVPEPVACRLVLQGHRHPRVRAVREPDDHQDRRGHAQEPGLPQGVQVPGRTRASRSGNGCSAGPASFYAPIFKRLWEQAIQVPQEKHGNITRLVTFSSMPLVLAAAVWGTHILLAAKG